MNALIRPANVTQITAHLEGSARSVSMSAGSEANEYTALYIKAFALQMTLAGWITTCLKEL